MESRGACAHAHGMGSRRRLRQATASLLAAPAPFGAPVVAVAQLVALLVAPHGHPPPHTHAHPFAALTLPLPPLVDRARFTAFVQQLPRAVVRAKGLVRFADAPDIMWVWNRTEGRRTVRPDASTPHAEAQPVALCIGAQLAHDALARAVSALAASSSSLPPRP